MSLITGAAHPLIVVVAERLTLKCLLEAGSNNPRDLMAKAFFIGQRSPIKFGKR
jgi:hypothetical protein